MNKMCQLNEDGSILYQFLTFIAFQGINVVIEWSAISARFDGNPKSLCAKIG